MKKTGQKVKQTKHEEVIECDDAAREAYAPQALVIDESSFVVRACDGDDEYVYIAAKDGRQYVVTEVYPGLRKKETNARTASRPIDLVFEQKYNTIEAVVQTIQKVLFEDFEFEKSEPIVTPAPGNVRQLRAVNG